MENEWYACFESRQKFDSLTLKGTNQSSKNTDNYGDSPFGRYPGKNFYPH